MERGEAEIRSSWESLEASKEAERRVGSTALAAASFDARHKVIVDSSFNKARENGEKLPGKNNERRTYAYLSRLERLIDKYGDKAEKRLWQASIKDGLLIDYDNVTESYWQSKRQELRDNGYGDIELTAHYKYELFNKERELQKESLEKWVNYLGDEHSPYPLWFKIYAWDGMTKMGKYDKSKGKYAVRNETTVAPYPNLDAEVLGGVFEVVNRYYGNNEKEFYTEDGERKIEFEKVVQSGSFAKIYNAVEHDIAPIIEPPEKPEDVHGEWIEYGIGEEDDVARAARGTGWCVASPSVGRHYLEYGTYGQDDDWGEDEGDKEYYPLESRFILFHLEDPSTGKLSKNAVASIRLNPDGQVAEISGLKEGQALDDSLVDIVAKKVKTLPGGEKFLEAFADKQELIRLDRKMQNNEDLTKEELEFVYEVIRPIHTLDTYNDYDPRIDELRQKYNIDYALNAGINANSLVPGLNYDDIVYNLDALVEHDVDINAITSKLYPRDIIDNLDMLIEHGANIDNIVSTLDSEYIAHNLKNLLNHGASIDIDKLLDDLAIRHDSDVSDYVPILVHNDVDVDRIISRFMERNGVSAELFDKLSDLKFDGKILWEKISQEDNALYDKYHDDYHGETFYYSYTESTPLRFLISTENVELLLKNGVNSEDIASALYSRERVKFDEDRKSMETLLKYGLDGNLAYGYIMSMPDSYWKQARVDVLNTNFKAILNNGITLESIDKWTLEKISNDNAIAMVEKFGYERILKDCAEYNLAEYGYDSLKNKIDAAAINVKESAKLVFENLPEDFFDNLPRGYDLLDIIDALLNNGIDIDEIIGKLSKNVLGVNKNVKYLLDNGGSPDMLIDRMIEFDEYRLSSSGGELVELLLSAGADVDKMISYDSSSTRNSHLESYLKYTDIQNVVEKAKPFYVWENIDNLRSHGANINLLELFKRSGDSVGSYIVDKALKAGLDVNDIIANLPVLDTWDEYRKNSLKTVLLDAGADPSSIEAIFKKENE